MKRFLISFFLLSAAFLMAGITDIQRQFIRDRTKVVRRDTASIPGHVVTHFRRGLETWCETNKLSVINVAENLRLSKLDLIVVLKAKGKWDVAKKFIRDSGYEDEWWACRWIDTNYPLFIAATNNIVQSGIAKDAEIKAVIEAAAE